MLNCVTFDHDALSTSLPVASRSYMLCTSESDFLNFPNLFPTTSSTRYRRLFVVIFAVFLLYISMSVTCFDAAVITLTCLR